MNNIDKAILVLHEMSMTREQIINLELTDEQLDFLAAEYDATIGED
jgi:hypothetical protein